MKDVDLPDHMYALVEPDKFRSHPLVSFTADQMPIRAALTLAPVDVEPPDEGLPPWLTWFGGHPLTLTADPGEWPRTSAGRPLHHVLQVDLASEKLNLRAELFNLTGLPSEGILQLFHDLETYGNPEDQGSGAWHLRWVEHDPEDDDDLELQAPPSDVPVLGDDDYREPMPLTLLNTAIVATVPSVLDVRDHLSETEQDRYMRLEEWLEMRTDDLNVLAPGPIEHDRPSPWDEDFEPDDSPSRLGGFGFVEENPDMGEALEAGLPLSEGDHHVLLVELNTAQLGAPVDWFHGLRPLQVWIRATDLAARDFNQVWCLIRTDA